MSKISKCPICSKIIDDKDYIPFCSKRCKQVDLGHWLLNSYTIPSSEASEDRDAEEKN